MSPAERWLSDTFQYSFRDRALFENALRHRSAPGASNERLEFLGDAILDLVISAEIFERCPDADEGDLSRLRAWLVKDTSLAKLATDAGLGEHLLLGGGEKKSGGHRRQSILADALEALFGAVYLDAGYDASKQVILSCFRERLGSLPDPDELRDPKTRLQEWLQARGRGLPQYTLDNVSGKAHRQHFDVSCHVDGAEPSQGSGASRRHAEQAAARSMLLALREGAGE